MSRMESPEALRDAVVQRTEDAVHSVAGKADQVTPRIAKRADRAAVRSGVLGLKTGTRVGAAGTRVGVKGTKLGARGLLFGAKAGLRERLHPVRDARLKAQLSRTSRELADETSDLGAAVASLNAVIKANRRAGAVGRSRLFAGVALGVLVTYHLDTEHGAERRRATGRRLRRALQG
jgi:hypothetical protein